MHCPECGIEIVIEQPKFCYECGHDLRGIPASTGDSVGGDKVGKDSIDFGNLDHSKGVAAGEGSKAEVNEIENQHNYPPPPPEHRREVSFLWGAFKSITVIAVSASIILLALVVSGIVDRDVVYSPSGPLAGIRERIEDLLATDTPVPTPVILPTATPIPTSIATLSASQADTQAAAQTTEAESVARIVARNATETAEAGGAAQATSIAASIAFETDSAAETATAQTVAIATEAPTPVPTLEPTLSVPDISVTILSPTDGSTESGEVIFSWNTTGALPDGYALDLLFWSDGDDPLTVNGLVDVNRIQGSSHKIDLDRVAGVRDMKYNWGLVLVETSPYRRIGLVSDVGTFVYKSSSGGSDPTAEPTPIRRDD